jgi:RNA polymerase sigma factor (sigma-70 family)
MENYEKDRSTLCGFLRRKFYRISDDEIYDAVDDSFDSQREHPQRKPANPSAETAYLKMICFRTLLRAIKRKERLSPLDFAAEIHADDAYSDIDEYIDLTNALQTLTSKEREVIVLHCIEGYNYSEISELLSIKIDTVKDRLKRAKRKLRKYYPPPTIIVPKAAGNRKYILKYFQRRPTHSHSLNTLYYITTNFITYADIHST